MIKDNDPGAMSCSRANVDLFSPPGPLLNKFILDACCGGRMMWYNKKHPNALYLDIRELEKGNIKDRPNFEVKPDLIGDFRKLEFNDKTFKLVVFDPPHLCSLGLSSWMAKKYGVLDKKTYETDLKHGFKECWRVLEDYGVLILKWSTETEKRSISLNKLIQIIGKEPLFGHTTGSKSHTHWLCFMKIPKEAESL